MGQMDFREQQFFESQRAFEIVSRMGHREKRAVLQEMRGSDVSTEWLVVPAGVTLGVWCCMHLLNKRRSPDADDSESDS